MDTKLDYTYGDTILKVENVSLIVDNNDGKGQKVLIQDISFEEKDVIREGRFQGQMIAIVGDSGRGKSTLFKVLSGLVPPTTGSIMIPDLKNGGGKIVKEGDMGLVDQKYTLFRDMTLFQQLMFAAAKGNVLKSERKDLVNMYLNNWHLSEAAHNHINDCSGGQKQRTAVIMQILRGNRFIIMDEPFSGLSIRGIQNTKEMMELTMAADELNTIIFSTHDLELAVELADQIYVIGYPRDEQGDLIRIGTIVSQYNLKELGLAWQPFGQGHLDLVKQISSDIINS
ncbi:MAG: ATP-binding cassette domain-containing protein [Candidatus Peribacteria bacterium]|jgi:polar amino acid transport system ATP-binding protein|nr:ATP-binding cassette domain-containing protein [Candidatus Peribacteria bacterium]